MSGLLRHGGPESTGPFLTPERQKAIMPTKRGGAATANTPAGLPRRASSKVWRLDTAALSSSEEMSSGKNLLSAEVELDFIQQETNIRIGSRESGMRYRIAPFLILRRHDLSQSDIEENSATGSSLGGTPWNRLNSREKWEACL